MRSSSADRERAVDVLKAAFSEGRLTKDEFEQRCGLAYGSQTYAELAALTADLPVGPLGALSPLDPPSPPDQAAQPPRPVAPYQAYPALPDRPPMNSMAVAALICALLPGITMVGGLVAGIIARQQIRVTGERGDAAARAAIVVSSIGIVLFMLIILIALLTGLTPAPRAPG